MAASAAPDSPWILFVEDDPDIAYVVRFMLERQQYRVVHADDGRKALALVRGPPPAAAVLDVMLPFHSGFEILKAIRACPGWASVPVIMLTALSQEDDVVRALDAGANDYISKPFKPDELLARVRRLAGAGG